MELAKKPDIKSFWVDQAKVFESIHEVHPDNVKLSTEALDQAGKIKKNFEQNKDRGQNNSRTDTQAGQEEKQNKAKKNDHNKGLGKTGNKTQKWSI